MTTGGLRGTTLGGRPPRRHTRAPHRTLGDAAGQAEREQLRALRLDDAYHSRDRDWLERTPKITKKCKKCGAWVYVVRFNHLGSHFTENELEYSLNFTRHVCRGCIKRRAHHIPKPPQVKQPVPLPKGRRDVRTQQHSEPVSPVEAVFSKLRKRRRPGVDNTIPYKKGVRRLLELTEPELRAAGLCGETLELARSCVREWCLKYYSLWGGHLADGLAYTFGRYRDEGIDPKVLEKMLLTIDKELGPPS